MCVCVCVCVCVRGQCMLNLSSMLECMADGLREKIK